jgi:peroxiredoxin
MIQIGEAAPHFSEKPLFGKTITIPDSLSKGPLVVHFVRHLSCPFAREALAQVQDRYADFDRVGIQVLAISQSDRTLAFDFVPRHHLLFPLVVDEGGRLRDAWSVGSDAFLLGTLKGQLRQAARTQTLRAFRHGRGLGLGQELQLGADFVIDRGGQVVHAAYHGSISDVPDLDTLLAVASGA